MTCPVRAESKGKSKTSREDDTSTQNDLGNIKEITTTARFTLFIFLF